MHEAVKASRLCAGFRVNPVRQVLVLGQGGYHAAGKTIDPRRGQERLHGVLHGHPAQEAELRSPYRGLGGRGAEFHRRVGAGPGGHRCRAAGHERRGHARADKTERIA